MFQFHSLLHSSRNSVKLRGSVIEWPKELVFLVSDNQMSLLVSKLVGVPTSAILLII